MWAVSVDRFPGGVDKVACVGISSLIRALESREVEDITDEARQARRLRVDDSQVLSAACGVVDALLRQHIREHPDRRQWRFKLMRYIADEVRFLLRQAHLAANIGCHQPSTQQYGADKREDDGP